MADKTKAPSAPKRSRADATKAAWENRKKLYGDSGISPDGIKRLGKPNSSPPDASAKPAAPKGKAKVAPAKVVSDVSAVSGVSKPAIPQKASPAATITPVKPEEVKSEELLTTANASDADTCRIEDKLNGVETLDGLLGL